MNATELTATIVFGFIASVMLYAYFGDRLVV
jgi:hypothetical protein